jgi:hypothetical protein
MPLYNQAANRTPLTRNVLGAGRYIPGDGLGFSTSTFAISANTLYCVPLWTDVLIDAMMLAVTTGAAGEARMGLYDCDENGNPSTLIEASATLDTTSIATVAGALAAPRRLTGPVWMVMVANATPTVASCAGAAQTGVRNLGSSSMLGSGTPYAFSVPFTYAALPASFPAGSRTGLNTVASIPALGVRTA